MANKLLRTEIRFAGDIRRNPSYSQYRSFVLISNSVRRIFSWFIYSLSRVPWNTPLLTFKYIFLEWKLLYSDTDFTKVCSHGKGRNNDIPAFVQAMTWHRTGDMSPSEPRMPLSNWRVYASLRRNELMNYAHKYVATMADKDID